MIDRLTLVDDVVNEVRVDRDLQRREARLQIGYEFDEPRAVVTLGEAFALHQSAFFEDGVRKEKAIRRDEIDARMIGAAREQRAQDARGRALACRDAAADRDDVRDFRLMSIEKLR